jgi:hypothetical protein
MTTLTVNHPLAKYAGRILANREYNGYNDSDFSALVEAEPGVFKWVEFASTRGYCPWGHTAPLDATDDVLDRYEEAQRANAERLSGELRDIERRECHIGSRVRVVGGRKYKGLEGTVFWRGVDRYRNNKMFTYYRIGIDTDNGRIFVPVGQCEVRVDDQWVAACDHDRQMFKFGLALLRLPDAHHVRQSVLSWRERNGG